MMNEKLEQILGADDDLGGDEVAYFDELMQAVTKCEGDTYNAVMYWLDDMCLATGKGCEKQFSLILRFLILENIRLKKRLEYIEPVAWQADSEMNSVQGRDY